MLTAPPNTMEEPTALEARPDPARPIVSTATRPAQGSRSRPPTPPPPVLLTQLQLQPRLTPPILPHIIPSRASPLLPLSENSSSPLTPSLLVSPLCLLLPRLLVAAMQYEAQVLLHITVPLQLPLMPLSSQSDLSHSPPSSQLKQSPVPLPLLEKTSPLYL